MLSYNLKNSKADKKAIREKKLAREKKSDIVLYRLMMAFILAMIGIFGMLSVKKSIDNEANFIMYVLPCLLVVSGIAFAAALIFFIMQRNRHVDDSDKLINSSNMLGAAAVFFGCAVYYGLALEASHIVVALIAAIVLYFVYHIYSKDFFAYSGLTALCAGLVYMSVANNVYTTIGTAVTFAEAVLAIVIAAAGVVFAIMLINGKGSITIGERKRKIFEGGFKIYPMFISAVLGAVGGALAIAMPAFAIYAVVAMLAAYLVIAVVYTVKLM